MSKFNSFSFIIFLLNLQSFNINFYLPFENVQNAWEELLNLIKHFLYC